MAVLAGIILLAAQPGTATADEGMWLPLFLKSLNYSDMQARGLRLTPEQIYSINEGSLKDAVVLFGGGCTGEIISREGLVLTNHHCGFGQIQSHSSVGNNLLEDGYWAKNRAEELKNPGLEVGFVIRMEDVTKPMMEALAKGSTRNEQEREAIVRKTSQDMANAATKGTHYQAFVRPFFYGNEYYMFVMENYRDVRLVGAPPSGIGKFGGDTDNWVWPRHTGDFSLFRVYSGPDGKPADYSANNIPLKPRRHLKLNLRGTQPGDFTMVMGFPGRTQEYLPSYGIITIAQYSNPYKIDVRTRRLAVLERYMKADEATRIQYAAKQSSIANAWKKWQGEQRGLDRLNTIADKQKEEATLTTWIAADAERTRKYGSTLPDLKKAYSRLQNVILPMEFYREAVTATEILAMAAVLDAVKKDFAEGKDATASIANFEKTIPGFYKDFNLTVDKDLAHVCWDAILTYIPANQLPPEIAKYKNKNGQGKHDFSFLDKMYAKSRLTNAEAATKLAQDLKKASGKAGSAILEKEPAFALLSAYLQHVREKLQPEYIAASDEIDLGIRTLITARRELEQDRKFYPDANSTLRVAYGQVKGYEPADGVKYLPYTHLEGVFEKKDTTIADYVVPARLQMLYDKKDYGQYADATGQLPLAFIATNHTTGGNSGSPVLDADGHLIGTNFDRCWEGTMSDLDYDPSQCRNIALDIRFTLWCIDKYGQAGWLLPEMDLIK